MGAYHAQLAPSSASRWTECTASINAAYGKPNESSEAARMGTCGHQMGAECLAEGHDADTYEGRVMGFPAEGHEDWADKFPAGTTFAYTHTVDEALVNAVQAYVDYVRQLVSTSGGELHVEQRVPIGHITGEEGAGGTSDCCIVAGDTFYSIDLKLGRSRVTAYDEIEPASMDILTGEPTPPKLRLNLQLALYALGGLEKHQLYGQIKRVKAIIVQPFLKGGSEYACEIDELLELGEWIKGKAEETRSNPQFKPSFDSCFFCKARLDCDARNRMVIEKTVQGFEDVETATPAPVPLPKLGSMWRLLPMVKRWVADVEDRVLSELDQGNAVHCDDGVGLKLVEGREGARKWKDDAAAEQAFKAMRFKDDVIYNKKVISPTQAEKLATPKKPKKGAEPEKPIIGKRQWGKLVEHITRAPASPEVALETDPRPPLRQAVDGLDDVEPPADCSDLF